MQVALGLAVVLERVQEERGALLDQIVLHEHVHDLVKVGQRSVGLVDQELSELQAMLRVDAHYAAKQVDVVRRELNLLGVQHDLLVLAGLDEALDDLHGHHGAQVDRERQSSVDGLDQIAELLARL